MTESEKPQSKPSQSTAIGDGIGLRLKAARDAKGLSQIDLHRATGLSRTVLINYEAGRHSPGVRELRLICDALKVSPNFLIYGTEEPHAKSDGLADALLSMGPAAVAPLMVMIPLIPAILGRDDTRAILVMIESLLKAKSPEGYLDVMGIVDATNLLSKNPAMKEIATAGQLLDDPDAQQQLHAWAEKLKEIKDKAGKS